MGADVGKSCRSRAGGRRCSWVGSRGGRLCIKCLIECLAVQGEGLLETCSGFVNAVEHVILKGADTADLVYKSLKRILVSGARGAGPCWGGRWPFCRDAGRSSRYRWGVADSCCCIGRRYGSGSGGQIRWNACSAECSLPSLDVTAFTSASVGSWRSEA